MGVVNVQTDEEKALSSRCRHIRSTCSTSRSSESLIGQRWGEELRVAAGIYRPWDIPSVSRCYHQPCDHRLGTCCCEQGHGYSSVRPLLFPHCTKYCVYPMTRLASDRPTFCHSQGIMLFGHGGSILFKSKSQNGRTYHFIEIKKCMSQYMSLKYVTILYCIVEVTWTRAGLWCILHQDGEDLMF